MAVEVLEEAADLENVPLETLSEEQMDEKVELIQTAMEEAYKRHRRSITNAVQEVVAGKAAPAEACSDEAVEEVVAGEAASEEVCSDDTAAVKSESSTAPVAVAKAVKEFVPASVETAARIRNAIAAAYQRQYTATPACNGAWYPEQAQWTSAGTAGQQWCGTEQWSQGDPASFQQQDQSATAFQGYDSYQAYGETGAYQACEGAVSYQGYGCAASTSACDRQGGFEGNDGTFYYGQAASDPPAEQWSQPQQQWSTAGQQDVSGGWSQSGAQAWSDQSAWGQSAEGYGQYDKATSWGGNSAVQAPWRLGSA